MSYEFQRPTMGNAYVIEGDLSKMSGSYDGKMDYTLKNSTGMEYETTEQGC